MLLMTRLFLLLFVLTSCSAKFRQDNHIVTQGHVIYSFKSGKIQCLSEIDPQGQLYVLLKSLNENTKIKFSGITKIKDYKTNKLKFVVKIVMIIEEETKLCSSWQNIQEISIVIDPLPVEKISLTGQQVYYSDQIFIMI